jgi:hypothetical protein
MMMLKPVPLAVTKPARVVPIGQTFSTIQNTVPRVKLEKMNFTLSARNRQLTSYSLHFGIGRSANHKAAYLQSHTNQTATRGGGGGGGGKMRSVYPSHSFTPYRGGKNGKK